ncbi:MAG: pyridine nucleotide-disulfide oxidoreductase [Pusillimonas sp.]|nr:MAG: pyridine nucleotide-disulfide oxidoreductase [Pusillimonas sp.]
MKCVIVGAGQAARRAAETLREQSAAVEIDLFGDEPDMPYDRPTLSKDVLRSQDAEGGVFVRDLAFYEEQRIGLHLNCPVVEIDRAGKRIWLENGQVVSYDRLLLATGSRARRFTGKVAAGALHYLRTLADTRSLRNALARSKRVVVIGGGFIGLEVAASAVSRGCAVTVFESANALLQRVMPQQISRYMYELHVAHGVDVRVGVVPYELCLNADRTVTVCTNADDVVADLVVAGIGAVPNVELARKAQIEVVNGIMVDECCRTNDSDIFAVGDVTNHYNPLLDRHIRVESWFVAESQPVVAATNMLGGNLIYAEFPWLWSDQYDCNLQTLGVFTDDLQVICRGKVESNKFSVLGVDDSGRLRAACTVNNGRDMAALKRIAASCKALNIDQLVDDAWPLRALSA